MPEDIRYGLIANGFSRIETEADDLDEGPVRKAQEYSQGGEVSWWLWSFDHWEDQECQHNSRKYLRESREDGVISHMKDRKEHVKALHGLE